MKFLNWLFRKTEQRERNDDSQEIRHTLSPAMPMSAAGATLSADAPKSRTEEKLEKAANKQRAS